MSELDLGTRKRIAANLRRLRALHRFQSAGEMARAIGMNRSHVLRLLSGERTPGLDLCLLVDRKLGCGLDWLCKSEPPPEWLDPDYVPQGGWSLAGLVCPTCGRSS